VRTYHETGRLIHRHVLLEKRADYGAQVIHRLAQDTGASERRLYECRQFYRCFPILRQVAELGWHRGRLLAQISDPAERNTLAAAAVKHDWPSAEIVQRVRSLNAAGATSAAAQFPPARLLQARRGTPGLHPIVDRGDGPVVDLGFRLYRELGRAAKFATGDIVRLDEDPAAPLGASRITRVNDATRYELFTYAATIRRVLDGDTLAAALAVAPGITLELKLRLRGLDCPELGTTAGRAAKRFVDGLVAAGDGVVISTTKPDKYDRYLADVFLPPAPSDKREAEIFLNNALLEHGHAVRYDSVGPKAE
jgi:micrococcal nuclease